MELIRERASRERNDAEARVEDAASMEFRDRERAEENARDGDEARAKDREDVR